MNRLSTLLILLTLALFSLGLLMVFDTTSAEMLDRSFDTGLAFPLMKQTVYAFCGIGLGIIVYRVGYQKWIEMAPILYAIVVAMLLFVFVPKIGMQLNGAHRWINVFGFTTVQPSEFAKLVLPLFYLNRLAKKEISSFFDFLKLLPLLLLPVVLILLEPDNGTALIITSSLVILFFLTGIRWRYWLLPIAMIVFVGAIYASTMPHVQDRMRVYLDPESDLLGKGHQPYQAKIAAGSGGLMGKGLGESLQKLNYLPEARSDYIAAIYAEEFGFIGIVILLILYMAIGFIGFTFAQRAFELNGFYLAGVLSYLFTFQAFLNLAIISGTLPSKGTSLPFFSQGGSSLIANILLVTLLIQIKEETCKRKNTWPSLQAEALDT